MTADHIDRATEIIDAHIRGWPTTGLGLPDLIARALNSTGLLATPERDATVAAKALREAAGRVRQMHDAATPRGIAAALMVDATRIEREAGESGADA